MGWKEGYDLLRRANLDSAVVGMSLFNAFRMNDPSAYHEPGTELFQQHVAKDFLDDVRKAGLAHDDAIAFLKEMGLDWAVDFGLGFKDEWGQPRA